MRHIHVVYVAVCFASLASSADAEPRHTTEAVALRKKPGEKEAAVAQLPANTVVTVLAEQGRWLKVSVNGAIGFLARTTVTEPEPAAATAPSAGWSAARHADGHEVTELFVEVTAASSLLRSEPKPTADKVSDVATGSRLVVVDATTTPGWIHARDDQGHEGWIARSQIDNGGSAVTVAGVDLQGAGISRDDFTRPAVAPISIRAELGIGYRSLGMDLTSNAEGGLTNYLVDADAMAAVVDVQGTMRITGRLFVAGDLRAQVSASSPGIDYPGPTSPPGKIPFKTVATDLGVRAGIRARDTFDLALRVGGHYDAFLPNNVDNVGMLPRERLLGATVGARVDIAPPTSRLGITARFDVLVVGGRAQTPGLEDGTGSTAHALWGGATVRYAVGRHLAPFAAYEFGRATTAWTGTSVREPSVTSTHRVDSSQVIQIGLSAEL